MAVLTIIRALDVGQHRLTGLNGQLLTFLGLRAFLPCSVYHDDFVTRAADIWIAVGVEWSGTLCIGRCTRPVLSTA